MCAGINRVSDWVYAHMPTQFHFFLNPDPLLLPSIFWKFNTRHHLIITDDLKIWSIHNQTLLKENNKVSKLSFQNPDL